MNRLQEGRWSVPAADNRAAIVAFFSKARVLPLDDEAGGLLYTFAGDDELWDELDDHHLIGQDARPIIHDWMEEEGYSTFLPERMGSHYTEAVSPLEKAIRVALSKVKPARVGLAAMKKAVAVLVRWFADSTAEEIQAMTEEAFLLEVYSKLDASDDEEDRAAVSVAIGDEENSGDCDSEAGCW